MFGRSAVLLRTVAASARYRERYRGPYRSSCPSPDGNAFAVSSQEARRRASVNQPPSPLPRRASFTNQELKGQSQYPRAQPDAGLGRVSLASTAVHEWPA